MCVTSATHTGSFRDPLVDGAYRALTAQIRGKQKLKELMPAYYAAHPVRGIACRRGGRPIAYVPLYHPSFGHANRYPGEYEALRTLLAIAGGDGSPATGGRA